MVAATVAPGVAALFSAVRRSWLPVSDWALIELQIRDVGTASTPLVGAYSRYGWDHPGPWPFYLLAVPYRLVGATRGLLAAAAVWNVVVLAVLAVVLLRRSTLLAAVALPALAVLVHSLGASFLSDPWNASLPVLPLVLLVPVAVLHLEGGRWTTPILAVLSSLIVQAHIGFLPVVAALVTTAAVGRLRLRRGNNMGAARPRGVTASLVATAVALVTLWAPPVVDQLEHRRGNLSRIARALVDPDRDLPASDRQAVGPRRGARILMHQLGVPAPWLGGPAELRRYRVDSVAAGGRIRDVLPLAAAAVLATGVAAHRRDRPALRLLVLASVAVAASFVGVATIRGPPYEWLVRWCWPVAMWAWVACLWALGRAIEARFRGNSMAAGRAALGFAIVVVTTASILTIGGTTLGLRPLAKSSTALEAVTPEVLEATREAAGVYLFVIAQYADLAHGMAVALDRAGIPWSIDLDEAAQERFDTTLTVALGEQPIVVSGPEARRLGTRLVASETLPGEESRHVIISVALARFDAAFLRSRFPFLT